MKRRFEFNITVVLWTDISCIRDFSVVIYELILTIQSDVQLKKKKKKKKKALSYTIILPSSESQMEPLMSLISTLSTLIDKYTKIFFRSSFFFINDLTVHAWWVGVKYERFLACTKKKKRKISGDGPWSFKLLFLSFLLDVFAN